MFSVKIQGRGSFWTRSLFYYIKILLDCHSPSAGFWSLWPDSAKMNQHLFFVFRLTLAEKCKVMRSWSPDQNATSKCQLPSLKFCVLRPQQSHKDFLQAQDYYGGTTLHLSLGIVQKNPTYWRVLVVTHPVCLGLSPDPSVCPIQMWGREWYGWQSSCLLRIPRVPPSSMYPTMFICFTFFRFFHSYCSDEFVMNCHYWVCLLLTGGSEMYVGDFERE